MEIVSFIGVIGSGKDHEAKKLADKGFVRVDFKDALLDLASVLVGYDVRENYEEFKLNVIGVVGNEPRLTYLAGKSLSDRLVGIFPDAMTGRRLLTRLGTQVVRNMIDPDYWVKAFRERALKALAAGKSVACADCRFPNEIEAICSMGILNTHFRFVDYHSPRYNPSLNHESEWLAQNLLKFGIKHLDLIPNHVLAEAMEMFGERLKAKRAEVGE